MGKAEEWGEESGVGKAEEWGEESGVGKVGACNVPPISPTANLSDPLPPHLFLLRLSSSPHPPPYLLPPCRNPLLLSPHHIPYHPAITFTPPPPYRPSSAVCAAAVSPAEEEVKEEEEKEKAKWKASRRMTPQSAVTAVTDVTARIRLRRA